MKASVSYPADMRAKAEREQKILVTFDYDGRAVKSHRLTMQGTFTPAEAKAIMEFMTAAFTKRAKGAPAGRPAAKYKPKKVLPYGATPK